MNWQDKPQVKMGNIGERAVMDYLLSKGHVPYTPVQEAGAHPFDFLCATKDKSSIYVAEVKTKPARLYFPDTGFNLQSWRGYRGIRDKYKMEVFCFFVDSARKSIYGNKLSVLELPRQITHGGKTICYPLQDRGIIYFPLEAMVTIATLTDAECREIEAHTTRAY